MTPDPFWAQLRADQAVRDHREAIYALNALASEIEDLADNLGEDANGLFRQWSEVVGQAVSLLGDGERP
jgi:hypothetical protein